MMFSYDTGSGGRTPLNESKTIPQYKLLPDVQGLGLGCLVQPPALNRV